MDWTKMTCSRELAQRMAELGICQDGAELIWHELNGEIVLKEVFDKYKYAKFTVAPTLHRMIEELPVSFILRNHIVDGYWVDSDGDWGVRKALHNCLPDKNICNALAKALIALEE